MVSGLLYGALGAVVSLSAIALFVNVFGTNLIGISMFGLIFLSGLLLSYYGLYLVLTGFDTPVSVDLDEYVLPIFL